ncbi:ATPase family gene 2 protein [Golovinomyces cichoracearum]|uniref:ATPase family gene 2 protein n=1 Tax=Golovinomyces cichoracearum TaxID=62708 RepID=A0A420J2Y4_9PEZI|nr:ATPase family gene 2 protein [Golovinomyces cichoracearum]
MSNIINCTKKTLEVKIRPISSQNNHERPDQKGISRVHLCKDALVELNISPGQVCYLRKLENDEEKKCDHQKKREAIAWLTTEKSLSKKVIQISKTFQEACDFKLGDYLTLEAAGTLCIADVIVLKDLTIDNSTDNIPMLEEADKSHWEWYIRELLGRAEVIFPGMIFKNILLRGPKRNFIVDTVNGSDYKIVKYVEECAVHIIAKSTPCSPDSPLINGRLQIIDISGFDQALLKLNRFLSNFDKNFKLKWAQRSCAVLLHGGHGTGKTFLINKIINLGWAKSIFRIDTDSKPSTIRTLFRDAKLSQPSIIVMDDLELIVSKEDTASQTIAKVIGEELDILSQTSDLYLPRVLVLAATLCAGNIPLILKKRGRLRTEILLPIPDAVSRKSILKSLDPPLPTDIYDEVLERLAERTHAYTAEDLVSLLDTACEIGEERAGKDEALNDEDYSLSQSDIEKALQLVRPTAMHDISLKPPTVRWDQIGGQDSVKKALRRAVETPLLYPERMKRIGATAKKGLLLYGPPGCSKTLSAQAMATEIGFNFFAVKGAELLNMYVGESERAIRDVFVRARTASPSIIFFDEIESIGGKREKNGRSTGVNVLTTLLNEMDGIETLKGVTVLAATNQPQALDLALLRPGRFDKLLYVAPPDLAGREEILHVKKRTMDFADDVNICELAKLTEGYSGAEIVGICQTACDEAMEKCETSGTELQVHMEDFIIAMKSVKKQITPEMIAGYERWAAGTWGAT